MTYKNPDPGAEKDAVQIAERTHEYFEKDLARVIKNDYYNKHWTPLSMELRHRAIDEIIRKYSHKMIELKQIRRNNEWRYKPQDQTYPQLKVDLRKFFPTWAYGGKTVRHIQ